MICFFLWGSKGKIVRASPEEIISSACPSCKGDLVLSHLKRYFTLYTIPICATSTVDTFYECNRCGQAFRTSIKGSLDFNRNIQSTGVSFTQAQTIHQPYGSMNLGQTRSINTRPYRSSNPPVINQHDVSAIKNDLGKLKENYGPLSPDVSSLRTRLIERSLLVNLGDEHILKWIEWFIRQSKSFDSDKLSEESYLQMLQSVENELRNFMPM